MNKKLRFFSLWIAALLFLFSACTGNPTKKNAPLTANENTGSDRQQLSSAATPSDTGTPENTQRPSEPESTEGFPLNKNNAESYGLAWIKKQANGADLLQAYDAMTQGAETLQQTVTFPVPIPLDQLKTLWYCYYDDHPEHFWVDTGYSYSYSGTQVLSISLNYLMTESEKHAAQPQLNRAVSDLLKGLDGSMTPYDLEKALHDRLILSCSYRNGIYAHSAYGALVEKAAVCDGYSRAFQILCKEAGIQALLVRGTSVNPSTQKKEDHAWNIVNLSGEYYHVDITWDDAGDPKTAPEIHYAWFNLPSAQIKQDHTVSNEGYPLPDCTATEHNYYVKNDRMIDTLSVEELLRRTYLQNGAYHCNVYVKNPNGASQWFDDNLDTLTERMNVDGYSFSVVFVGKEIYYTIIPK